MSSTAAQEDLTGDWEVEADGEDDYSSVASDDGVATRDDEGDLSGVGDTPATTAFDRRTLGEDYIASLRNNSSLHVTTAGQVAKAYDKKAEYGVFSLFFTAVFRDRLRKWTSDVLVEEGHAKITESESTHI
ncbi:hypothetical protein PF008_g31517 [Phytophthora fragariae]|uniref:PiggyBac transposable element-derived protein domain-containing protein n=1 Tax=Phytophthora fragariae TaxID=53985 RepID=A0A6G0Q2K0_9STRA|nr:hypothetical protein PF008_g31517 [Phytophthora fragariae]